MCGDVHVPVEDWPAGRLGNFREPGVGGCSAELPPGPCGFPPAVASPPLPPAPKPPPLSGSAADTVLFTQSVYEQIPTLHYGRNMCLERRGLSYFHH